MQQCRRRVDDVGQHRAAEVQTEGVDALLGRLVAQVDAPVD